MDDYKALAQAARELIDSKCAPSEGASLIAFSNKIAAVNNFLLSVINNEIELKALTQSPVLVDGAPKGSTPKKVKQ